jgi:hypothetical protein
MAEALVRHESPTEYFRDLVESALKRQNLEARQLTSFYLVNLLTGFVHFDRSATPLEEEALGIRLVKAMQAAGIRQRDELRQVGDLSLFMSGFFADNLARGPVDIDYYISLGECAYGSLARHGDDTFGDVFDELSEKFTAFVDVLSEVSENGALASNADLLRLYERWLRTRSRRSGELLAARGIVPIASVGNRSIQ